MILALPLLGALALVGLFAYVHSEHYARRRFDQRVQKVLEAMRNG